ncbi:MAG: hypothetical protein IKS71_04180 [Bacteroidales bacterium]|nr:hypothetical protein [Bacteroidales bacterium]
MRAKYLFIYIAAGIAFLAVSAWVFLTNGKNAKALRAKYKLGGLLLTCTAMLSVASCGQVPHPGVTCYDVEVTCYEPIVNDYAHIVSSRQDENGIWLVSKGDSLKVQIQGPTYAKYSVVISTFVDSKAGDVLQTESFDAESGDCFEHSFVFAPADETYRGAALAQIFGKDEQLGEDMELSINYNIIITDGEN